MKKFILFPVLILLVNLILIACDEEESEYYNFKIIATKGNFSGYYFVDGGSFKTFTGTALSSENNFYSFEKNLNNPDSVYIQAVGDDEYTTTISVYIYADDEVVASSTDSYSVDDGDAFVSLDYTFTDEDDD